MKLLCRHNRVEIIRAHANSETGKNYWRLQAGVDKHSCLIFVRCRDCKKILEATSDQLYDTVTNHRE